jgi:hypothetical protein
VANSSTSHSGPAWKGRAIEQLVGAYCVLASGGRLNVSTPLYDDEGVDLVFSLRGQAATLAVQVKSRFSHSRRVRTGSFRMDLKKSTFAARGDLAIIGVLFDEDRNEVTDCWVIPSRQFRRLVSGQAKGRGSAWVMRTSLRDSKADRWQRFREDWGNLSARIIDLLERLA